MEKRCDWGTANILLTEYHDKEWGVPLHDDQKLFEFLVLEGFQAGLSWLTVLKKRDAFRDAFDNFNPEKVAQYDDKKVEELMLNPGIIRNRLKIKAGIDNAVCFLKIQKEFGSFDKYIWQFVDYKPVVNCFRTIKELPPYC